MQEAGHAEADSWAGAELRDPPAMLAGFVKYLAGIGAAELRVEDRMDPADEWAPDDEAIANRARIQGCVMLGNKFGLGAPYSRDYFVCGPTSRQLARDLVALSRYRARLYDGVPAAVPDSFRKKEFEALVRGRGAAWIAVASCAAELESFGRRDDMADALANPDFPREGVLEVISAVEKSGIIRPLE